MVCKESTSEATLTQQVGELGLGARGDMRSENLPSLLAICQGIFENLLEVRDPSIVEGGQRQKAEHDV